MQFFPGSAFPPIELGDLVTIACEEARALTADEGEAARLATLAITELLATTQNDRALRDLAGGG